MQRGGLQVPLKRLVKLAIVNRMLSGLNCVIRELFHIGCKPIGEDRAEWELARLQFEYNETISKLIPKIKSEIEPDEKSQFDAFMNHVADELKKMESDQNLKKSD